jgi:hypothetical protein
VTSHHEPPFSNLETRISVKNGIQRDSAARGLSVEQRWDVEIGHPGATRNELWMVPKLHQLNAAVLRDVHNI